MVTVRRKYPRYGVRRAVVLLLILWAAVIGSVRSCDYLFPGPGASHPHSEVR